MYRKNITLELITPMFSVGADENIAEFRITELKALLRLTFREFFEYTSLEDLTEKETILFGSTKRKSPVTIRFGKDGNIRCEDKEVLVLHKKKFKAPALPIGTKINIVFESRNNMFLEVYMDILKLASMTGGLGKRSRKGMGSFRFESIDEEIISTNNNFEKLPKGGDNDLIFYTIETKDLKGDKKTYTFRTRKFSMDGYEKDKYIKYKIECKDNMEDIHYVKYLHKILIENKINQENGAKDAVRSVLEEISNLTHERLVNYQDFISKETIKAIEKLKDKNFDDEKKFGSVLNKEILGNCSEGELSRFASPVYVTSYQELGGTGLNAYIIIKELNYKYIYEKITEKKVDSEYITGYINKIKECCGVKR